MFKNKVSMISLSFLIGFFCAWLLFKNEDQNTSDQLQRQDISINQSNTNETPVPKPNKEKLPLAKNNENNDLTIIIEEQKEEITRLRRQVMEYQEIDPYKPTTDSVALRQAQISEYFELSDAKVLLEGSIKASVDNFLKDLPEEDKNEVMDVYQEVFAWEKLEPILYDVYAQVFTTQELYELNTFYRSEVGQRFVEKTPELTQGTMVKLQEALQDGMPKIQAKIKEINEKNNKNKAH